MNGKTFKAACNMPFGESLKAFCLSLLLLAITTGAIAQRTCGTMEYHQQLMDTDPVYRANRERIETLTEKYLANKDNRERREDAQTITIPVVVHIIWKTPDQNIDDERVHEQIKILNDDYNLRNADKVNIPAPFAPLAGIYNIEFCLAPWQDDQGQWQDPITRTQTNRTSFNPGPNEMKKFSTGGHDAVNPGEYLNLWVCNLRDGLLGYAQFPGGPPEFDGVVMTTYAFGLTSGGPSGRFGLGRTASHEVGHWLNLYHIWGDRACGDDLVDDTPQQRSKNLGVPVFPHRPNDCDTNNPNGDMFMNFMDYSDDKELHMFTKGQVDRSMALFRPTGSRETLLSSAFLCSTSPGLRQGCPCSAPEQPQFLDVGESAVKFAWRKDKTTDKEYEIRYRKSVGGAWTSLPRQADTLIEITGLERSQLYMFQVRAICKSSNITSDWRSLITGSSPGAFQCDEMTSQIPLLTAEIAEITWNTSPYYQKIEFSYAPYVNGAPEKYTRFQFDPSVTSIRLNNLEPGTTYEVVIEGFCIGGRKRFKNHFTTRGCDKPYDLDYDLVNRNTVELTWKSFNAPDEVVDFILSYRQEGDDSTRVDIPNVQPPYTLSNLPQNTRYEWIVRTNCTFGQGGWSDVSNFATTNCEKPANLQVNNITENSARLSWDPPAAGDVTSYNVRHRPEGTRNWTTNIALQPFLTITGLSAGYGYEVEVESICQVGGGTSQNVGTTFSTPGCETPDTELGWVSHNEAQIIFKEAFPPGSNAQFRVLENGNVIWTEEANGIPRNGSWILEGMEANKTYTGQFRIECANGDAGAWTSYTINTKACPLPTDLSHGYPAGAGDVSVLIRWRLPQGEPDEYEVNLKDAGGTVIYDRATYGGGNTYMTLNGLTASTSYTLRLNTICSGNVQEGPEYQFTTRSAANARSSESTEQANLLSASIVPNPVQDQVRVTVQQQGLITAFAERTTFRVLDYQGRELYRQDFDQQQADYQLSLGHLLPGMYLIETSRGGFSTTNKVIIEP